MLEDKDAYAIIAVKKLKDAKQFYEDILGLKIASEDPKGIYYKSGNTKILVYESQYAGSSGTTSVTWKVEDVADTVQSLKAFGVQFEQYDIPYVTYDNYDGDIHIFAHNERAAWFKDPDGNILCVSDF